MSTVDAQHHIKIIVKEKLEKKNLRTWYEAVSKSAPNGVVTSLQTFKEGVGPKSIQLIHKVEEDGHHYIIPLTRDLIEDEVHPVFEMFGSMYEGDFDIDMSGWEGCCGGQVESETVVVEIEDDDYKRLCEKLSKAMHHRWMEDKVEDGWRFAMELNETDKTSPLLRGWDDLPEAYRDVDYNLPETLMNVFEEEGMVLVDKAELDKLLK